VAGAGVSGLNVIATRSVSSDAYTGYLYTFKGVSTTAVALTLPSGLAGTKRMPSLISYRGFCYVAGLFNRLLMVLPNGKVCVAGLRAPSSAPTLAASGTGITGDAIVYLAFVMKDDAGQIIQISNLSKPSSTVSLANQGRGWSGIPTTSPDAHATHVWGFVSMDGALPRFCWERRLGDTATVTESIPTDQLLLMEAAPVDADGDLDIGARGVLDYASFGIMYHDRMVWVHPNYPGVIVSKLQEPYAVNSDPLRSRYPTRDGEQPTALGIDGDTLIVFCQRSWYAFDGWSENDFRMAKLPGNFGCLSHRSPKNLDGILYFHSEEGLCARINGRGVNVMSRTRREAYIRAVKANPEFYVDAQGMDSMDGLYRGLVPQPTASVKTRVWVSDYRVQSEDGEGQLWTTDDFMTRENDCIGMMQVPGGTAPVFVYGGADGKIRYEDATDGDDDADAAAGTYSGSKAGRVRFPHLYPNGQPGDAAHGRSFQALDLFAEHTGVAITGKVYAGDQNIVDTTQTPVSVEFPAREDSRYLGEATRRETVEECAGAGASVELTWTNAAASSATGVAIKLHGVGLLHGPGDRPPARA
jgi:hypothetical protein